MSLALIACAYTLVEYKTYYIFCRAARDHLAMSPEASRSSVCEGSMVMARWGDRNWYPANVLNEDKNGK